MSEKTDYNLLKKHLPGKRDRIERIENTAGVGTPDINYCIGGTEGWIEMKSPKEPLRANSKLFGGNHKLSQDQKNWFLRQRMAGGKAWVMIATNKRWMLIDGKYADDVNELTIDELKAIACWLALKPILKVQWEDLRETLTGEVK